MRVTEGLRLGSLLGSLLAESNRLPMVLQSKPALLAAGAMLRAGGCGCGCDGNFASVRLIGAPGLAPLIDAPDGCVASIGVGALLTRAVVPRLQRVIAADAAVGDGRCAVGLPLMVAGISGSGGGWLEVVSKGVGGLSRGSAQADLDLLAAR